MQGMKNRTQSELLGKSKPYGIQTKNSYLVFIEISNNHSDKKGQSNHATQEYKNMNIDSMHLYKWQKKKKYGYPSKPMKAAVVEFKGFQCVLTGPTRWIITSLTSTQPFKDRTSNNASIALPTLSKLKFRGFALWVRKRNVPMICCWEAPWSNIYNSTMGCKVYLALGRQARWCSFTNS